MDILFLLSFCARCKDTARRDSDTAHLEAVCRDDGTAVPEASADTLEVTARLSWTFSRHTGDDGAAVLDLQLTHRR